MQIKKKLAKKKSAQGINKQIFSYTADESQKLETDPNILEICVNLWPSNITSRNLSLPINWRYEQRFDHSNVF